MLVSNYILIAALEIYALLILLSLFLMFYSRGQRKLIRRQQEKLLEILQNNESTQSALPQTPTSIESYKHHLDRQLEETFIRYQTLGGTDDIATLPFQGSSVAQQTLALRYHFLMAEKAAATQENNQLVINWDLLEQHLAKLLPTENIDEQAMELVASKKQIENLEIFKQLFFDMEKQWLKAQENADTYYEKLAEKIGNVDDKTDFSDLLEQYHSVYSDVHNLMLSRRQHLEKNPAVIYKATNRTDPNITNEIIKLRNVAVDQHRIINQLQRKLEAAKTTTEKEVVIQDLQQQLQRQARFAKEAEVCVKLLEDELARNHERMHHQEQLLEKMQLTNDENQRIKEHLQNFALESKNLVSTMTDLEQENEKLKLHLSTNNEAELLKEVQTDFLILQAQYEELENKYLLLTRKNGQPG